MEDKWTIVDGELYHHGIAGQKWGHRNGPPYPLSASQASVAEKKAGYKEAKSANKEARREYSRSYNSAYDYSSRHPISQFVKGSAHQKESDKRWQDAMEKSEALNKAKANTKEARADYKQAKKDYRKEKLSEIDVSNVAKKGAAIMAGAAAAYGIHQLLRHPEVIDAGKNTIKELGQKAVQIPEVKAAVALGKGTVKVAKKLGSSEFGQLATGVGVMAVSVSTLKKQIDDLKNPQFDENATNLDKTVQTVKKASDVASTVNTLAKGPMNQNSNRNGKGFDQNLLSKDRDLKKILGDPKGIAPEDEKRYQQLIYGKSDDQKAVIRTLRRQGFSVDQIEQYVFHSAMPNAWILKDGVLIHGWI